MTETTDEEEFDNPTETSGEFPPTFLAFVASLVIGGGLILGSVPGVNTALGAGPVDLYRVTGVGVLFLLGVVFIFGIGYIAGEENGGDADR